MANDCQVWHVSGEPGAGHCIEHGIARMFCSRCSKQIESLNERIKEYDERMEKIAAEVYPEVSLLKQVKGVGTQIALDLCSDDRGPYRFAKSRQVGCFWIATWPQELRGERATEGHQQEGDRYLRTMMVQGAHYILGPFGEDSDLRRGD